MPISDSPEDGRPVVAILGAGNIGTGLARLFAENGQRVRLWTVDMHVLKEVRESRRNSKYLPGIDLSDEVEIWPGLDDVLPGAWLVVFAVPSQAVRDVARRVAPFVSRDQIMMNAAKGLELESRLRMSQVLAEELGRKLPVQIATMGGPAIALEMAQGQPLALVVAARDEQVVATIKEAMENDFLKVETTSDLCGVEIGASLKNVYAVALGMCDGLGLGANTKAFLASVALSEMIEVAHAVEAQARTLSSLAGLGDLLTTGYSVHSRNRTLGEKMAAGSDWRQFLETHTVEGVAACRSIKEMVDRESLSLPLLEMISEVLLGGQAAGEALPKFLRGFSYQERDRRGA